MRIRSKTRSESCRSPAGVMKDIGSNPGTVAAGRAIVDILSRIMRREVLKSLRFAALLLALAAPITPAQAGQSVSLILNWTPAADHSPFYYAKSQGWYANAGIDLSIEVGKGSGVSSLKVGSGGAPFGIALVRRGQGRAPARSPARAAGVPLCPSSESNRSSETRDDACVSVGAAGTPST